MNFLNWKDKDDSRRTRQSQTNHGQEMAMYLESKTAELREQYSRNFPQSRPTTALEQKIWDEMLATNGGNQHGSSLPQINNGEHSGSNFGGQGNNYNYGSGTIINNYGTMNIQNNHYYGSGEEPLKPR